MAPLVPVVEDVSGAMVLGIEDGSASERLMLDALQILISTGLPLLSKRGLPFSSSGLYIPVGLNALMSPADINST